MSSDPRCPQCNSENVYSDGNLWICPECSHEWSIHANSTEKVEVVEDNLIRDANGNVLNDGDSVTVIKELKIKGSSSAVKVGTKVRNIRLTPDSSDGHNIACKIDGLGAINLKSEFVRKA
ncbi:MAG: zinc ribbon domain-containing protein YjdM [Pseudobdellovibrio sp.]